MDSQNIIREWVLPLTVITLALTHAKEYGPIAVIAVSALFFFGYVFLEFQKIEKQVNSED